ncbi:MAG: VanZ family protein [Candidatus Aminicenantes bacterium]
MTMRKFLYFTPALLYYLVIFLVSSASYDIDVRISFLDKAVHFFEFSLLAFLLSVGYFRTVKYSIKTKSAVTIFSGVMLGILDEIHQSFVPGRHFEIGDMAADGLGILIGLILYLYFSKRMRI